MRKYMKRYLDGNKPKPHMIDLGSSFAPVPGSTLMEQIDLFMAEGVTPDLPPADLGFDDEDERDFDGRPIVDPAGDIRTDPLEYAQGKIDSRGRDSFNKAYDATGLGDDGPDVD